MNRNKMLGLLQQSVLWDIVIAGGGATGLGAAVDAASRGYKVLLIEQSDFAKGTSSRSTKLVHGGVRYLAQGNIKLVRESLKERAILLKNAPHVCREIPFILPGFSFRQKIYYGIGLKIYEAFSGRRSLGKTKWLSAKSTLQKLPAINNKKLSGSVLYHDGQFDDSRLAINLAQTAAENGAAILNYCTLISLIKNGEKINGIVAEDQLSGIQYNINCKCLINATGVFTDSIMKMDDPLHEAVVTVSQGAHIVVNNHFFPGTNAMIIPKTDDGRVLFAVPWHNKVVIGTTDTPVDNITNEPIALKEEIDFIIHHANRYLTSNIHYSDIKTVFAGLRPLLKSARDKKTAFLPRDHSIFISKNGMITITGGKWTTYRSMAMHVIDTAAFVSNLEKKNCITASLKIHGYIEDTDSDNPLSIYGSDAAAIKHLSIDNPSLKEKIHPELPYTRAEIIWAIQNEMAMTVDDILARRTRALFLDAKASIESATLVASIMAEVMGHDKEWENKQVNAFKEIAYHYLIH